MEFEAALKISVFDFYAFVVITCDYDCEPIDLSLACHYTHSFLWTCAMNYVVILSCKFVLCN